jgi:exodeoxyribonuclease-3
MVFCMKIVSWNVNGIRACHNKGFIDYLNKEKADIVCLQEIKALEEQFPDEVMERPEHLYIHSAQKKGYSGVAIFSKTEPLNVWEGLGIEEFDSEGRCLIAEYDNFILFNCYFPNGQRDHNRVPYKLAFSDAVMEEGLKLKQKLKKEVIICGDYNTAHKEIDLANPKTNTKSTGFLPNERAWIDKFIENGFTDTFRLFTPDENGHYTWWTYRNNCREKNVGWRIDYFFVTDSMKDRIKKSYHRPEVLGSDHCPLVLEF